MTQMIRRAGRAAIAGVVLATVAAGTALAAPAYYPSGPQLDVPKSATTGWTVCFSKNFDDASTMAGVLAACPGEYLMLAGAPVGAANYQLLAAAPRADVLFDTGVNYDVTHAANGTGWYQHDNYSWGFAPAGASVFKYECDNGAADANDAYRLCIHTLNGYPYGFRVGADRYLQSGTRSHEFFVLQAASGPKCFGLTPTISYVGDNSPRTIQGTSGDDVIYAGGGNDTIYGNGGNDTICGVGGNDTIRGGVGDDKVFGGNGDDDLGGQVGNDEVVGGQGNDRVNGAEGDDAVRGGDGNDIANGGDGDDTVYGGADDDVLAGNAGTDICNGNAGVNRVIGNGQCEKVTNATVSNNTPAPASADAAVVASAADPDESNGNAATLMPAADAATVGDVEGGNVTPQGDGN